MTGSERFARITKEEEEIHKVDDWTVVFITTACGKKGVAKDEIDDINSANMKDICPSCCPDHVTTTVKKL